MIEAETLKLLEWHRLCQHLSTFAATKLGVVAARNLKLPETKAESIKLLAQTQEIYNLEQKLDSEWSFEGIQDVGESLDRAILGGILSAEQLLAIATTLSGVRRLRRTIDACSDKIEIPNLIELVSELRTYPELEQQIHYCIDDRAEITERASPKLSEIRLSLKKLRDRVYQILHSILQKQPGAIQEQVITQRGDRFVIPVKAPQKDAIPGIVHDISSTGSTLYIEPRAIVELGNKLSQARRQEKREEEAILRALTEEVAAVHPDLEQLLAIATILDLATARARYSLWLEANPPRFIDFDRNETVTLRKLRHPLLVWQKQHEQGMEVVPIDIQIRQPIRVVAITGPNTGGKTVTLKTFGIVALMAKAGLFVPAKEPVELPWFEQILADIGDEQSIEQSLSTFSGHIRRISRIIDALGDSSAEETSQNQSLVLLDEVGAGTDPAEGSALAIALLKYLAEQSLLTIATTHYGELKALKYQDERFENASVEFNDSTLQPTYRLLWGIPGRSNALTIARRLGLKSEVVDLAQQGMGGASEDVDRVIAALEAQRREQEIKAESANKLLEQTERFYAEVSDKAASLQERERDLRQYQEKAVQEAIAAAKAEIAQVIRQLQQGQQTAQNAQKATEKLNQIATHQLTSDKPKASKPGYLPQVGERVRVTNLGQTAEVLSVSQDRMEATVRFGLMKMAVSLAEIESLDGKKVEIPVKPKSPPPSATVVSSSKPAVLVRTSQNTIDLRGSRVMNATSDLERAIASATASGVLWIIHGKGTGKLREGVHEFLEQHPQVERFEIAPQNEGGAGVTIAYLI